MERWTSFHRRLRQHRVMGPTMLKRNISLVLAVVAIGAATAVAAVADGGDQSSPPGSEAVQVDATEPEAAAAMAALRGDRVDGDALPPDVAEAFGRRAAFGMNPDLSRRLIANTTHSVYAIPAAGHVCMALTVGAGASVNCPRTTDLAAGRAAAGTVTLEEGAIAIYGLVPDGVDSVTVDAGAARPTAIGVSNNAYFTVVPAGTDLRSVGYTGPGGAVEFPIYDPALGTGN